MRILLIYEMIPEETKFFVFETIVAGSELYNTLLSANGHYTNLSGEEGDNDATDFLNQNLCGLRGYSVKELPTLGAFDLVVHSGFAM